MVTCPRLKQVQQRIVQMPGLLSVRAWQFSPAETWEFYKSYDQAANLHRQALHHT